MFPEQFGPFEFWPPQPGTSNGGWSLSCEQMALPGVYVDRDTALLAAGIILANYSEGRQMLLALQEQANTSTPDRMIRIADMDAVEKAVEAVDWIGNVQRDLTSLLRHRLDRNPDMSPTELIDSIDLDKEEP